MTAVVNARSLLTTPFPFPSGLKRNEEREREEVEETEEDDEGGINVRIKRSSGVARILE